MSAFLFYAIALLFAIACLFPFYSRYYFVVGRMRATLVRNGYMLVPEKWSLNAYKSVFSSNTIYSAYGVSIFYDGHRLSSEFVCNKHGRVCAVRGKNEIPEQNWRFFLLFYDAVQRRARTELYLDQQVPRAAGTIFGVYILPALLKPVEYVFYCVIFFNEISHRPERIGVYRRRGGSKGALQHYSAPFNACAGNDCAVFTRSPIGTDWLTAVLYISDDHLQSLQYVIMKIIRNIEAATKLAAQATQDRCRNGAARHTPSGWQRLLSPSGPIVLLYPFFTEILCPPACARAGVKG